MIEESPELGGKEEEQVVIPAVLEQVMAIAADENQIVHLDSNASLQKQMQADGFVPTSNEYGVTHDGKTYMAQRADHPDTGEVRVYYSDVADAKAVQHVGR